MMGREEWFRPSNVLGEETDGPTSKKRKVEGEKKSYLRYINPHLHCVWSNVIEILRFFPFCWG